MMIYAKIAAMVLLLGVPGGAVAGAEGPSEVHKIIAARSAEFAKTFNTGDALAAAQFYTEDGVLIAPGAEVQRGRISLASTMARAFETGKLKLTLTTLNVEEKGADIIEIGTWEQTVRFDDGETVKGSGQYLVVWEKGSDDVWRMDYDMVNYDPPEGLLR